MADPRGRSQGLPGRPSGVKEKQVERQEAIKILTQAGRSDAAVEIMEKHHRGAEATYRAIQDDPDLNDEAKQSRQASHYLGVMETVGRQLTDMASRVRSVDHDDAGEIFGVKGLDGDPASLAISRRDAADRVASSGSVQEKRDLLARATRSGDEVLARAVVEWAVQARDSKTVNQYLETRPHHDEGLKRLWDAQRSGGTDLRVTLAVAGLRPHQLRHLQPHEVERLARRS
jgi:hypothetical protein